MPTPRTCAECGAPLPNDAPDGLCPRCGFDAALASPPQPPASFSPSDLFSPTTVREAGTSQPAVGGEQAASAETAPILKAQSHIGPYKLLQQIGDGGCGVVHMAEQQ